MENKYKTTKTTISLINYHFVFCPRYRRKIFEIPDIERGFTHTLKNICKEMQIEIISIECCEDYVHMILNCSPDRSPTDIVKKIKSTTSKILREEFIQLNKMSSLWTRNCFISTEENVNSDVIKEYVENQRKRY